MNMTFLLVLLTVGDAGKINAAFVNTESIEICQTKREKLTTISMAAGTEIVESRCFETPYVLTKFSHNSVETPARVNYVISVGVDNLSIKQANSKMSCIVDVEKESLGHTAEVYCASSSQQIIKGS